MPIAKSLSFEYNSIAMVSPGKTSDNNIHSAWLSLDKGWSGRAALYRDRGKSFTREEWSECLSQPDLLFEDIEKILKMGSKNYVAIKNLSIRGAHLPVVIKRQYVGSGIRQFFRSFRPGKALRNFSTALRLKSRGISVTNPLAALQQRHNFRTKQSILITEYLINSSNLYSFASNNLPAINHTEQYKVKKQLSHQLAAVLASLHNKGLWHRDSKATNFVVYKNNQDNYRVLLTDMDGIKRYVLPCRRRRFRSLWHLAASLMSLSGVNRTDYLRTFIAYCDLTGLESSLRRPLFKLLARRAQAKRIRNMAASRHR